MEPATSSPRQILSSGAPWESAVGYSRAVRVGNTIAVAGTTAAHPHDAEGAKDHAAGAYAQTIEILERIEWALSQLGASMNDVIRTRMFVVNIDDWLEIGRAHAEYFGDIRPAATMVEVKRLIDPDLLVEIEVDAVVAE